MVAGRTRSVKLGKVLRRRAPVQMLRAVAVRSRGGLRRAAPLNRGL